MAARLRAKPGAHAVPVTIGDMTSTRVPGEFRLVYLVYNTIMNVTTQDEQVAVFENAAAHLGAGGCFVVEVIVPQLREVPPGAAGRVFTWSPGTSESRRSTTSSARSRGRTTGSSSKGGCPPLGAVPLCLALRARLDGQAGRHAPT